MPTDLKPKNLKSSKSRSDDRGSSIARQSGILRVGILMGGPSSEHEVSLNTGATVLENLNKDKYEAVPVTITKDGKWLIKGKQTSMEKAFQNFNLIFNALHGSFGEDGKVQALMEYYGVRYTGSGITASALAMDKLRSREIFKLAGLQVANTLKIRKGENYQAILNVFVNKVTNFPVVVKPCSNGSSVGVEIVTNHAELEKAIKSAFRVDKKVLIEEFIEGREVTCGVLDPALQRADTFSNENRSLSDGASNFLTLTIGSATALPVTEIIPKQGHKFFNYKAKYKFGHSDEITPAQLDEETTKKIQEIAVRAHQILGCKAYSRTDMIIRTVKQDQLEFGRSSENFSNIYVLETNTLPGLTSNSLLPKAALVAGLTMGQLVDKIIDSSLA